MDDTRIERRIGVKATSDRLWDLICDLDGWAAWNAHDTQVTGAIAYGGRLNTTEILPGRAPRLAQGRVAEWRPLVKLVWTERRGFLFANVRYLGIEELDKHSCIVTSGARFVGLRGELFLDKHKSALRQAHEDIVQGLRRAAEG